MAHVDFLPETLFSAMSSMQKEAEKTQSPAAWLRLRRLPVSGMTPIEQGISPISSIRPPMA